MRTSKTGFLMSLLLVLGMLSTAMAQTTAGNITLGRAEMIGTTMISGASPASSSSTSRPRMMPHRDLAAARRGSMPKEMASAAAALVATLSVPAPQPNSVTSGGDRVGFPGLTTVDTANTNGFVTTPPDQGLCVGNGFVLETINSVMVVYSKTGSQLSPPESVNSFFAADPNATFLADPRCYYDRPTQRWFVSVINVLNFNTNRSNLYLAVSQTSDPRSAFTVYSIDTTDDGLNGTPSDPGCTTASPCFGDQPLLGADAFGIYLSTNEFGVFSDTFNGAQIYAVSKAALEAGAPFTLVHIGNLPLAEGISYSVQPASSPDLSGAAGSGVEYFLSALEFNSTLDNRIAVWALTNTSSLARHRPRVSLTNVVINSEVYGFPPPATQKAGPYPLGQSLGEPEELIDPDDRMQQAVFARGDLWGALNTIVSDGTNLNAGIAYFDVKPSLREGKLTATIRGQNYVSVKGASVLFPAVGVTADGTAAAAFTLTGPSYFPSAAFSRLTPSHARSVHIVAAGAAPQDDFSGYPEFGFGSGVARWGDYSYAVADGGSLWLATEYIPGGIDSTIYVTNFGTFIYTVNLDE